MDESSKRLLLSRGRQILGKIPYAIYIYGIYWIIKNFFDYRTKRPIAKDILDCFRKGASPSLENITSQLCTAEQINSYKYKKWAWKMYSPPRYSRKQWEFAYILEALEQHGKLVSNNNALGFGCGLEPIPAILANYGISVLATDLERSSAQKKGWVDTLQNSGNLENILKNNHRIIKPQIFYDKVEYKPLDMNNIPEDLQNFDIIWSACALEHLGSIKHGLEFILNSCKCLAPGGVAVHTTEFNLSSNDNTLNAEDCCIYRRKDIESLESELMKRGFNLSHVNYNCGSGSVDEYIDLPPFKMSPHLKLELAGYCVTSIGLIIQRPKIYSSH